MRLDTLTRRTALAATVAAMVGMSALAPTTALSAQGDAKGKTVEYITFGLQYEYQVAMVEGMKKRAEEAGIVLNVIDCKGDPNNQVGAASDRQARAVRRSRTRHGHRARRHAAGARPHP